MVKRFIYPCVLALFVLASAYSFSEQLIKIDGVQQQGVWKTFTVTQDGILEIITTTTPVPTANTIKGTITSGFFPGNTIGIKGVTVTLGPTNLSQTTDVNGGYVFTNVTSGGYTVTPSHARGSYVFTPPEAPVTVTTNQTVVADFTADPVTPDKTYTIGGRVIDLTGAVLPGVTMQLYLGSKLLDSDVLTGPNGWYTIPELPMD